MNCENEKPIAKIYSKLIGKKIREKRLEKGLTQEQLAEMADIDAKHLGRLERAEKTPYGTTLINLFYTLEIDPKELYNLYEEALKQLDGQ